MDSDLKKVILKTVYSAVMQECPAHGKEVCWWTTAKWPPWSGDCIRLFCGRPVRRWINKRKQMVQKSAILVRR